MSKLDELNILFEENVEELASLDFAKYVREVLPNDGILVPLDEAEDLYGDALNYHRALPNSALSPMMVSTLTNSVRFCTEKREKQLSGLGSAVVKFEPFIVSLMKEIYEYLDIEMPHELPKYHKVQAPEGHVHRYICYWAWSTVPVERIHSSSVNILVDLANSYLKGEEFTKQRSFGTGEVNGKLKGLLRLSDLIKKKKEDSTVQEVTTEQIVPEAEVTVPTEDTSDDALVVESTEIAFQRSLLREQEPDVQVSLFASRKYLQKYDDAMRRGLSFSLTIDDIQSLLRRKVCHFTKERLVVNIGENHIKNGEIPENYLTIDRLNPNRGYEPDNVVVCSHRINQLKAKLTEEQFNQVLSMHSLMNGMDESQKYALQSMMGIS